MSPEPPPISDDEGGGGAGNRGGRRSAARLAAVQALYEMEVAGAPADPVLREFLEHRWQGQEAPHGAEPDAAFLGDLVRGVGARSAELDALITPALSADWPLERLEVLLRAILRAGAYELLAREDVPPRVVIAEYLNVAHAFFTGREPALVNGVLDSLARTLRPDALGEARARE